eukprot:6190247-Pleurochrysis_carterae.AAC.1
MVRIYLYLALATAPAATICLLQHRGLQHKWRPHPSWSTSTDRLLYSTGIFVAKRFNQPRSNKLSIAKAAPADTGRATAILKRQTAEATIWRRYWASAGPSDGELLVASTQGRRTSESNSRLDSEHRQL